MATAPEGAGAGAGSSKMPGQAWATASCDRVYYLHSLRCGQAASHNACAEPREA